MSKMNRSRINALIRDAEAFLEGYRIILPPFSTWTPEDWKTKGSEAAEIVNRALGWDVTDFGSGDFDHVGLVLFTLRNGDPNALKRGSGKMYAEKMLIVEVNQHTPMHHHVQKTEDIINHGGGLLVMQVYNDDGAGNLADTSVTVSIDSVESTVPAGTILRLEPGQSVTLTPHLYHEFWAEGGRVLSREVSVVNDDATDNMFLEDAERYLEIVEDEAPLYPLCNEIGQFYNPTRG